MENKLGGHAAVAAFYRELIADHRCIFPSQRELIQIIEKKNKLIIALAERVAKQSDALSRCAEKR